MKYGDRESLKAVRCVVQITQNGEAVYLVSDWHQGLHVPGCDATSRIYNNRYGCAQRRNYNEDRFTRDKWHVFAAVRRQLDRDRVEVLFLHRNVLHGVEVTCATFSLSGDVLSIMRKSGVFVSQTITCSNRSYDRRTRDIGFRRGTPDVPPRVRRERRKCARERNRACAPGRH